MTDPEDRQRMAMLAWAEAIEAAYAAVCQHRGREPIDNIASFTPEQHALAWEATAALSAGVAVLARACVRDGMTWSAILDIALQERNESYRHCAASHSPRDT